MLASDADRMEAKKERGLTTRKSNKPLIEKRRRARINESLRQLKEIIVRERQLDNVRCNRLEKADILEMTVDYIRHVSREESSASCLQNAYELGVERCVQEMFEFMSSQRDFQETSVTQKLANHCRKILHHHAHTEELIQRLAGNKRAISSKLETVADSSTSPKRHRLDDESESSLSTCGEVGLTDCEVHQSREISKPETVSSTKPTSETSLLSESSEVSSNCSRVSIVPVSSPDVSCANTAIQPQSDTCTSSCCYNDASPQIFSHMNIVEPAAGQSANHTTTGRVQDIDRANIPDPQQDVQIVNIAAMAVGQETAQQNSKAVIFTCSGNIVLLVDSSNAILPQAVGQNLIPAIQNTISVVPTSIMYTNNPSTITNNGFQKPSITGSCAVPLVYQTRHPQQQNLVQTFTNVAPTYAPLVLNGSIIVKHESDRNICLSSPDDCHSRYLFMPQHLQTVQTQCSQFPTGTSNLGSNNVQFTPNQGSQNVQNLSNKIVQNVQDTSNLTFSSVQDTCNQMSPHVQDTCNRMFPHVQDTCNRMFPNVQDTCTGMFPNVQDIIPSPTSHTVQNTGSQTSKTLMTASSQTSQPDTQVPAQTSHINTYLHEVSTPPDDNSACSINFKQPSIVNTADHKQTETDASLHVLPTVQSMPLTREYNFNVGSKTLQDIWPRDLRDARDNEKAECKESSTTRKLAHVSLDIPTCITSPRIETYYKSLPYDQHDISHEEASKSIISSELNSLVKPNCVSDSSDNRGIHKTVSLKSYTLYPPDNVSSSIPARSLLVRSISGEQRVCLQECGQVLDLSRKVEDNSSNVTETTTVTAETDINNNISNCIRGKRLSSKITSRSEEPIGMIPNDELHVKPRNDVNLNLNMYKVPSQVDCAFDQIAGPPSNKFDETGQVWRPWGINQ